MDTRTRYALCLVSFNLRIFNNVPMVHKLIISFVQRIVKTNKTEDDEMEAEALTQDEVSQMQGQYHDVTVRSWRLWR